MNIQRLYLEKYFGKQESIQRYIAEVSKYVKKGNAESAYATLYKRGVLKAFLETEIKHSGK